MADPDLKGRKLSVEESKKKMTSATRKEPPQPGNAAIPITHDNKLSSIDMYPDYAPASDDKSDHFGPYIAAKNAEIVRLSTENMQLISRCAAKQTEHVNTIAKYKDMHERYTILVEKQRKLVDRLRDSQEKHNNQLKDKDDEIRGLNQSLLKRLREKEEVIRQVEKLTKENAELLQIHAELGEEIAALKIENADLVQDVYPLELKIRELQASAANMKMTNQFHVEKCKNNGDIKAENEDPASQSGSHDLMTPHSNVTQESHSNPHATSRQTNKRKVYGRYDHDNRGGSSSKYSSGYRGHGFRRHDSHDLYVADRHEHYTPDQGQEYSNPSSKVTSRLLTPHLSPNASHCSFKTADAVGSRESDTSEGLNFAFVPKSPKATTGATKGILPTKNHPQQWKPDVKGKSIVRKRKRDENSALKASDDA